jgi:hypothetical protein
LSFAQEIETGVAPILTRIFTEECESLHCRKILEVVTSPAPASLTNNLTLTANHRCKTCRFASISMWSWQLLGAELRKRDGTFNGVGTRAYSPVCMKPPNAWAPTSHVTQQDLLRPTGRHDADSRRRATGEAGGARVASAAGADTACECIRRFQAAVAKTAFTNG